MLATCAENELSGIIETVGAPAFVVDATEDGRLRPLCMNRRFRTMSGFSEEDFRDFVERDPGAGLRGCLDVSGAVDFDHQFVLDGHAHWVRIGVVPLLDCAGRAARLMGTATDVTARRTAGQELARMAELYRGVLDEQQDLISRFLPDTTLTYLNDAYARMLGGTPGSLVGRRFADTLPASDRERVVTLFGSRTALGDGDSPVMVNENAVVTASGEQRWIRWRNVALADRAGRIEGYQSVGTDVTDRKLAQDGMRTAQQSLRDVIDSISEGFALYDADDRLVLYNDNYVAATPQLAAFDSPAGVTFEEILRAGIARREIPDAGADREAWVAERVAAHRFPPETPTEQRLPDGRHFRVSERRTRDGGIVCILTDITPLREQEAKVRESERRLRLLADSATDIICLHAPDTTILYVSPSCEKQLGRAPADMVGRRLGEFIHAGDLPLIERKHAEMMDGLPGPAVFRLRHSDGRWLWFESVAGRLEGTPEGHGGLLTAMREVSERVRYEQELREASDRLAAQAVELRKLAIDLDAARRVAEQASDAKSQFLAMMSHELRTPMTGVMGMVDLLMGTPLSGEQRGYVQTLAASAGILLTILNDVLDFSKIEAGQLQMETIPFDLRRTVADVIQLFAGRAAEKRLRLTADIPAGAPSVVSGDPTRLRQVLFNLVGNAIKFTAAGSVRVRLAEFRDEEGDRVLLRFEVTDSGMGMTEEQRSRLFEAFVQADTTTTRRFGGTGLGLAICKRLVEAMDGEIGVRSALVKGSVFHFTVRLGRSRAELPPPEPAPAAPAAAGRRARVLLAEDNEVNRLMVVRMLERLGHRVDAVEDGRAAVEAARRGGYDLILMDMQMPVLDGASATREIRALPGPAGRVPIAALTADVVSGNRERYLEAGLDGYFTKPIDWSALASAIAALTHGTGKAGEAEEGGTPPDGAGDCPPEPGTDLLVELPLIDAGRLDELRAAVGESYAMMMEMFPDSAREELAALRTALDSGDAGSSRRAAHSLKGVAASFGATRVQAIAHLLEDADHPPEEAFRLLARLESALEDTLAALGLTETAA
ncbi:PAS domain S-box protein [Skermanella mucosa]|uniref:PAS domain S-box protein n=1 Tax=Skermanella mucosa TaxID=1789672 RepID=UPI00192A7FEC|nr:PAS domain S-box protein [Skermanella mucosa]UEM22345.1 PAS domain S-box protein [Skermanella mucosa]